MSVKKRFLKHPRTQAPLAWLLAGFIRLVYATSRKSYWIEEEARPYMSGAENAIFAFWHGRMMLLPCFEPPGRKMHVLSSHHRDGRLTAMVIGRFGEATIDGSSSRGGRAAAKQMLRALKRGDNISITPDGPRGPAQVVAAYGIATIARLSGRPVVPVAFASTRHIRLKSWDRFMLALPFGRVAVCVGEPIFVTCEKGAGEEEATRHIEQAMNALTQQADGLAHA